jgi:hypothetical protein
MNLREHWVTITGYENSSSGYKVIVSSWGEEFAGDSGEHEKLDLVEFANNRNWLSVVSAYRSF